MSEPESLSDIDRDGLPAGNDGDLDGGEHVLIAGAAFTRTQPAYSRLGSDDWCFDGRHAALAPAAHGLVPHPMSCGASTAMRNRLCASPQARRAVTAGVLRAAGAIAAHEGVMLERSTLTDWVGQAARLLTPLAQAIARHVLRANKIHGDDTPIRVFGGKGSKAKTGRLWVYVRDDRPGAGQAPPAGWFQYSVNRQGERRVLWP